MDIRYFDTLESTNNYCKLLDLDKVEEFTIIRAGQQTAGIGQKGNVWVSEPYKNLTFSLILKPTFIPAKAQYTLTMMIAVAVAESVAECLQQKDVFIKWPNDIYIYEKKICGILATSYIQQEKISHTICGIGLNINQTTFPDWIPNPVSLKLLDGKEHDLEIVLHSLIEKIRKYYNILKSDSTEIKEAYLSKLYRRGIEAEYKYKGVKIRGTILGVNDFGHLILMSTNRGTLNCDLKELEFIY